MGVKQTAFVESKRRFLKQLGLIGIAVTGLPPALYQAGYDDFLYTGTNFLDEYQKTPENLDVSASTAHQLWSNPGSSAAFTLLTILTQLNGAGNRTNRALPFVQPHMYKRPAPHDPDAAQMMSLLIQDPAYKNMPDKCILFEPVARQFHGGVAFFDASAFYVKESKSLVFVFRGNNAGWGNIKQIEAVNITLTGQPALGDERALKFMEEVKQAVQGSGLDVEHATVFGHSLGAGAAVYTTAEMLHDEYWRKTLKTSPEMVLFEGWKEKDAAVAIANRYHVPLRDIRKHTTSVRHYPSTFAAQADNPPLGDKTELIVQKKGWPEPIERISLHQIDETSKGLWSGKTKVISISPDRLSFDKAPCPFLLQGAEALYNFGVNYTPEIQIAIDTAKNAVLGLGLMALKDLGTGLGRFLDRRAQGLAEAERLRQAQSAQAGHGIE